MSNFDITELLRDGQTDRRTDFDINVDRHMDGQTKGWMNGKGDAYVAKPGCQGDVSYKV